MIPVRETSEVVTIYPGTYIYMYIYNMDELPEGYYIPMYAYIIYIYIIIPYG